MKGIALILLVSLVGCAAQPKQPVASSQPAAPTAAELVDQGYGHLSNRRTKKAIAFFDQAIDACTADGSNGDRKVYAARGAAESIYYLLKAAAEKQDAVVMSSTCADARYLKGYAVLDFGQIELAEELVRQAIEMSPVNAMYLSELGHIYHAKEDWHAAFEVFSLAEEFAPTYSPEHLKQQELTRAMRGVGFSLIELDRLAEAEDKFNACLDIDPNDAMAKKEILYIQSLRNEQKINL